MNKLEIVFSNTYIIHHATMGVANVAEIKR